MANTVITSTTNSIKAVFNDDAVLVSRTSGTWGKQSITSVELDPGEFVEVNMKYGRNWTVSFDGSKGMKIDSIDGVAPTSNNDLYTKLSVLIE